MKSLIERITSTAIFNLQKECDVENVRVTLNRKMAWSFTMNDEVKMALYSNVLLFP